VVVEPAVGNPTDAGFGKRDNAPMWISFPYRPQSSSASRFTAGAFGFLAFQRMPRGSLALFLRSSLATAAQPQPPRGKVLP
jgi:hypothetical protein